MPCHCSRMHIWVWQLNHQWNHNNACAWNQLQWAPCLFLGRGDRHTHKRAHTQTQYAKLPCAGLRERGVLLWILIWAWQREQCVSPHNLGARGRGESSICVGHTCKSGNTYIWKHTPKCNSQTYMFICTHTHTQPISKRVWRGGGRCDQK